MATRRVIDSIQVPDRPTIQSPAGAERRVPGQVFGAGQASGIGDDPNSFEHVVDKYGGLTNVAGVAAYAPELARANGEALLKELTAKGLSPNLLEALTAVQRRVPRLFGHLTNVVENRKGLDAMKALGQQITSDIAPKLSSLEINPNQTRRGTFSTVGHEMAHVAQNLRSGRTLPTNPIGVNPSNPDHALKFNDRYALFNKVVGYHKNPYEQSANRSGVQFADRELPNHPLTLLRNKLRQMGLLD